MLVHGPPEDGRQRGGAGGTGPEDLLRHTRPHERVGARTARRGTHGGIAHGRGDGAVWSDVVRGTTRHKWDKRQRIKDQHGEREIEFADVDEHNVVTKTVMGARVRQQAGVPHGTHHERIMRGESTCRASIRPRSSQICTT